MLSMLRRVSAALLAVCIFLALLTGCSRDVTDTLQNENPQNENLQNENLQNENPQDDIPGSSVDPIVPDEPKVQWASYNSTQDEPFTAKNIADNSMYYNGIVPIKEDGRYRIEIRGENDPSRTIVLKGEYGKCYEIKFLTKLDGIRVARVNTDPRTMPEGSIIEYTADDSVRYYDGQPSEKGSRNFMYVCREKNEYLVVYTGTKTAGVYIGERTMLHSEDTDDNWWIPENAGSITKTDGTFGSYQWSSDQIIEELYEPYRQKYPEYITRSFLGLDQSGKYLMYGYVYTPQNYNTTIFITGGMHGNEESAYFALAKLMQLISDATPQDSLLYTLRENVRFVVVPIINVWGVSQNHNGTAAISRSRIRRNSANIDLNRDFEALSQKESQNVYNFFKQYASDIDIALDFHNASTEGRSLYYNFINYSVNSVANYKTTNHMYHRLMELGYCKEEPDITTIPGSYEKSDVYIEGRLWNEFKVPTITVEHFTNSTFPYSYSEKGFTLGVETYGNFVIQNALFFIDYNSK